MLNNYPFWIRCITADEEGGTADPSGETTGQPTGDDDAAPAPEKGREQGWDDLFKGKTPQQVADDITRWKQHARTWENRATKNKQELEETSAKLGDLPDPDEHSRVKTELERAQSELRLVNTLAALRADIPALLDSRSFMTAAGDVDPSDDEYAEKVRELVRQRTNLTPPSGVWGAQETPGGKTSGTDLWTLVHGDKD
ncbi:hypothetical protein [Corynebacterium pygosceleis]|uniref:hypothetical protein n=1 Tax=Corynebacterium pygosceleis TaxID=2800406 RepID=UPI0020030F17|nr:hypothetical protein [Corynebacterium pygosceleis]MCK7676351.1 hypothetical protein [Corynebacterium pygosceleis]